MKAIRQFTLAMVCAVTAGFAQHAPPTSEFVYGVYHIRAIGDTGVQYFEHNLTATTTRQETLDAEFELTFSRDKKTGKPRISMKAIRYDHDLTYRQVMDDSGPETASESDYKTSLAPNAIDHQLPATLQIVWVGKTDGAKTRRLRMSCSEPYTDTVLKTTVTTKFRKGPDKVQNGFTLRRGERLFLDLDWSKAHWRDDYNGSLAAADDRDYLIPHTKTPWVKVSADWSLSPFP